MREISPLSEALKGKTPEDPAFSRRTREKENLNMLQFIFGLVVWLVVALGIRAAVAWLYGRRIGGKVFVVIGFPFYICYGLVEKLVYLAYDVPDYIRETRKKTVFRDYFGFESEDTGLLQWWFENKKGQLQKAFEDQNGVINKNVFVEQIKDLKSEWKKGCEICDSFCISHPYSYY